MTDTPAEPQTPAWIARLDVRDLGTLTGTVTRVQAVVGDEKSSLKDLSRVLQNDPTLVTKVLRIANSPGYMVTPEPVTTISRASSLIGFDTIRNICITNRLLDALLEQRQLPQGVEDRLLTRVASSLHAAAQARMLMVGAGNREREEAFLAALLERIGESAFWSVGGAEVEALDAALSEPGCNAEAVVRARLGGSFAEMSRALVRAWGLETALNPADNGYHRDTGPGQAQVVQLANEIADAAAHDGWQSPRMKALVAQVAKLLGIEADEAAIRMRACGKQAEDLAACYGASQLARRMTHKPPPEAPRRKPVADGSPAESRNDAALGGDSAVQLRMLRQMATLSTTGNSDINSVIRAAMEGIQEGIGMERTLTALLTPDRRELQVRLWLGEGGEDWSKGFRFAITPGRNLLNDCLAELQSARYDARNPGTVGKRIPAPLLRFCAGQDFVLAPVAVGSRSIGVIYADRAPRGGTVTEQEFAAFVHFSQQLGSCLAQLTQRRT
jgi:HD-like signal output (HDOD) protein